jgi:ABC-type uncharacterized transport system involved in gliding motility auxiliary subunit
MKLTPKRRLQALAHHGLFVVLLVSLTALGAYLAREYRIEQDLTASHRNTLSAATLGVLKQLDAPVVVTAYAVARDARGDNVHRRIAEFLRPYQRARPDMKVVFVDPREEPRAAAAAGVRAPVEIVLEYRRRTEHLVELNEQAFANALMRLARGAERLVLWLDGHGERKLDGAANHDLGGFGRELQKQGLRLSSVNLALAQDVPANAALMMISGPQVPVAAAEVEKIRRHLVKGGNLLWLIDAEPLRGLQPIAEMLGLVLPPGVVVDPRAAEYQASAAFAVGVAAGYARHPVTATLDLNTLFPYSRPVDVIESDDWRTTPLIEVAQRGWVATAGKPGTEVRFDPERDIRGPITIAVALERAVGDRQQRIVVVGNGHFLSNTFLGNGGNLNLGMNMVNWLAGDDTLIAIPPRGGADSRLDLDPAMLHLVALSFLLALPLAFAVTGAAIWWRRRRA